LPAAAQGKPVEVWFMDEARIGQQGTLTHVWAPRGTRPRAVRDHLHIPTDPSRAFRRKPAGNSDRSQPPMGVSKTWGSLLACLGLIGLADA